ncbi:hypothetical protein FHR76_002204 [Rhizobium sp. RAS22]|nr:hypothetical protein [Rhizobium sp. RAS22]
MAQDLFAELMSMAAKPKKKEPKAPVTFADKFKKAVRVQREKVALIGKPEYKKANTDWFTPTAEPNVWAVRLGRKTIVLDDANGNPQKSFRAEGPEQINRIFDIAVELVDTNDQFRNAVLEQYGSEEEKAALQVTPPRKRRRTTI